MLLPINVIASQSIQQCLRRSPKVYRLGVCIGVSDVDFATPGVRNSNSCAPQRFFSFLSTWYQAPLQFSLYFSSRSMNHASFLVHLGKKLPIFDDGKRRREVLLWVEFSCG